MKCQKHLDKSGRINGRQNCLLTHGHRGECRFTRARTVLKKGSPKLGRLRSRRELQIVWLAQEIYVKFAPGEQIDPMPRLQRAFEQAELFWKYADDRFVNSETRK